MNKEGTTESIENSLEELKNTLERIEKENEELYQTLGLSAHMAQEILNDTATMSQRLSPEACAFIQNERKVLEEILEARLEKVRAVKKNPTAPPSGHWIFVK